MVEAWQRQHRRGLSMDSYYRVLRAEHKDRRKLPPSSSNSAAKANQLPESEHPLAMMVSIVGVDLRIDPLLETVAVRRACFGWNACFVEEICNTLARKHHYF
eukprot:TRINITY_DN1499_c0_g1_i13.p1 TRINITY_DN1499_c0_g1~~TRINITY_DN1499_c0_g1_i13.p1  ORF type:complete len:116 (-),score=30.55 TRINITY_DN1499_c0_g1_i13:15-320(-)